MNETQKRIGKPIVGVAHRDAVHIAVVPVIAGMNLKPGERLILLGNKAYVAMGDEPVGIVDPFLEDNVQEDEPFWMFMFPNTVTELRHDWSHPGVSPEVEITGDRAESEKWLSDFANKYGMDYATMIHEAQYVGYIVTHDVGDIHSWDEVEEDRNVFFDHLEVVLGRKFDSHHRGETELSCSC